MKNIHLILLLSTIGLVSYAQKFPVDTLAKTGPINNRINVLILGDGFTAAEMPKFVTEANNFMNYFLSYAPYNKYKDYFNFYAIKTPSNESGATNLGKSPDAYPNQPIETKDTYYGCAFGTNNIHRLVYPTKPSNVANVIANNFASSDLTIIISNTPWYGGSGGNWATYTLNQAAPDLAVHEIGHTFSGLGDEYWSGTSLAFERSNLTKTNLASTIKWKNWLNRENVGIFEHTGTGAAGWYKPTEANCLMQQLDRKNCAVCRETTIDKIIRLIKPIDSFLPSNATKTVIGATAQVFSLKLLKPNPNSLQVEWRLDGQLIDHNKDQISVLRSQLTNKTGTLTVSVFDSTDLTKTESTKAARNYVQSWPLEKTDLPNNPTVSPSKAICMGESTTLTASNCAGTLAWNNGQTTASIDVEPTETTTYSVNCTVNDLKSEDVKITITVTPLPVATATNGGPYLEGTTIELTGTGGGTYAWTGPASFVSTEASPKIVESKVVNAGTYSLVVSKDGCKVTVTTSVTVNPILSINPNGTGEVTVYPNPAESNILIDLSKIKSFSNRIQLELFDKKGNRLWQKESREDSEVLDLQNFSSGPYILKVSAGGYRSNLKIVKQ